MTISRKLFLAALVSTGAMVQAINMTGFDSNLLKPWVAKSQQAVDFVASSLETTKSAYATAKSYAKNLYNQQKEALKGIKAELKTMYKSAKAAGDATWFVKKQTYKAYKVSVYRNWKKTQLFPAL